MVNETNKPNQNVENEQLQERLLASTQQLHEMQEEHRQLVQEMATLRQRAAELSSQSAAQKQQRKTQNAVASQQQETSAVTSHKSSKTVVSSTSSTIKQSSSSSMHMESVDEAEEAKTAAEQTVGNDEEEEAKYLQEKLNEIAQLKAQFNRVQHMIDTTSLIEQHMANKDKISQDLKQSGISATQTTTSKVSQKTTTSTSTTSTSSSTKKLTKGMSTEAMQQAATEQSSASAAAKKLTKGMSTETCSMSQKTSSSSTSSSSKTLTKGMSTETMQQETSSVAQKQMTSQIDESGKETMQSTAIAQQVKQNSQQKQLNGQTMLEESSTVAQTIGEQNNNGEITTVSEEAMEALQRRRLEDNRISEIAERAANKTINGQEVMATSEAVEMLTAGEDAASAATTTTQQPENESGELINAMLNMFTDFSSDLRGQADSLRAERERIKTLKDELIQRKKAP